MNHPVIASANGNEYHKRLIQEAENFRRAKVFTDRQTQLTVFGKLWEQINSLFDQITGKSADLPA